MRLAKKLDWKELNIMSVHYCIFSAAYYIILSPVSCLAITFRKYVVMLKVQMRETADLVFVFITNRVPTMTTKGVTKWFLQVSGVVRGSRGQKGEGKFETENMWPETSPLYRNRGRQCGCQIRQPANNDFGQWAFYF
jgi:hypothetical protein